MKKLIGQQSEKKGDLVLFSSVSWDYLFTFVECSYIGLIHVMLQSLVIPQYTLLSGVLHIFLRGPGVTVVLWKCVLKLDNRLISGRFIIRNIPASREGLSCSQSNV